jgi:hypothetical protein
LVCQLEPLFPQQMVEETLGQVASRIRRLPPAADEGVDRFPVNLADAFQRVALADRIGPGSNRPEIGPRGRLELRAGTSGDVPRQISFGHGDVRIRQRRR